MPSHLNHTSMPSPTPLGAPYEAQHVHAVYEEIAAHFSSTRYKPWPIVEGFVRAQRPGAVGADVGCGNGKYLGVRGGGEVFIVGTDRSTNLARIAQQQHTRHDALVADTLALPHPAGSFDFALCIAVIHHFSTPARRVDALRSILDVLRGGGQALVYVWALEQKESRRGWDEGCEQDVMVPWVLREKKEKKKRGQGEGEEEGEAKESAEQNEGNRTFLRYYHLYRKGELEADLEAAGGVVVESGYEKDNWWAVARRK